MLRISFITSVVFFLIHTCFANETRKTRIVGGEDAIEGRYPYQVLLLLSQSICGGTLIAPDYVLTAAHCGVASIAQIGRHDITSRTEEFEQINIEYGIIHPDFNSFTQDNDFMLLKLQTPSTYDAVTLDDGSMDLSEGTAVTAMGWGVTCFGDENLSEILQEGEVDIVSNESCKVSYSSINLVTDTMLCAARTGVDSCQGDSGGPLIIKGNDAASDVQVGITSWGNGCASEGFPGVYARVAVVYDWIQEVMDFEPSALSVLKYRVKSAFKRTIWEANHDI